MSFTYNIESDDCEAQLDFFTKQTPKIQGRNQYLCNSIAVNDL